MDKTASSPAALTIPQPIHAGRSRSRPLSFRLALGALGAAALHGLLAAAAIFCVVARPEPAEVPITVDLVVADAAADTVSDAAPALAPAVVDGAAATPVPVPEPAAEPALAPPAMPAGLPSPPVSPREVKKHAPAKPKPATAAVPTKREATKRQPRPLPQRAADGPAPPEAASTSGQDPPSSGAAGDGPGASAPRPDHRAAAGPPAGAPPELAAPNLSGYRQGILVRLARAKRYPGDALARGEQGRAVVRIVLDRRGAVVRWSLVEGSGSPRLDREVAALVERAAPYPPLPVGFPRDTIEIVAPVEFSLN